MARFIVFRIFSIVVELVQLRYRSDRNKDLEIVLLRYQLKALTQQQASTKLTNDNRLILTVLFTQLRQHAKKTLTQLEETLQIVKPDTVLRWHRDLVKRKWTYATNTGGRPRMDPQIVQLVLNFATHNDWGYGKIAGELRKLGYTISEQTVANILKQYGIRPLPDRKPSMSWQHLMQHYKDQLFACDFFTVDLLFLNTIYVLFFIHIDTRRVYFAGCTDHPNQQWMTQQARQFVWNFDALDSITRFLIHDRDTKFPRSFDTVFEDQGFHIIQTPIRAPNANAFAERWVRTVRDECLRKLIIVNQIHLRSVLREYIHYYNHRRPHQGIDQSSPSPYPCQIGGAIKRRDILGGIIRDYYRDAA